MHHGEEKPRNNVNTTIFIVGMHSCSCTLMNLIKCKNFSVQDSYCALNSTWQDWRKFIPCCMWPNACKCLGMFGWVIYFAHQSFMVVLTQPVMQIHYDVRYVENSVDEDPVRKELYFLREQGWTVFELLALPFDHDIFTEDTVLTKFRAYIKKTVTARLSPLVTAIFPEEKAPDKRSRMNKAHTIGAYFANGARNVGQSPNGDLITFQAWAASPGSAASKFRYILLGLTFTMRLQLERSGDQGMTTHKQLLTSLQQQRRKPVQQVKKCTARLHCLLLASHATPPAQPVALCRPEPSQPRPAARAP